MHAALFIQTKSGVSHHVYLLLREIAVESVVKLHQIAVYRPWPLPLLYDNDTNFMTKPLTQFLHKRCHISQGVVVDPASEDLIDLRYCLPDISGNCSFP